MADRLQGLRWVKNENGGQMRVLTLPVKISQTLYRGNVVVLSATSGSVAVASEGATSLYGVCLQAKSTTATQVTAMMQIAPLTADAIWAVKGAPSTMTLAYNGSPWRNKLVDLEIPTTGYHRCDTAGSTKTFRIVGWPSQTAEATGAGREWYVKIVGTATHYDFTIQVAT